MKRALIGALLTAGLLSASSLAARHLGPVARRGGSGTVSANRVGPLKIGQATPADLRRFAGSKAHASEFQPGTVPFGLVHYGLAQGWADYYFASVGHGWRFDGFITGSRRFDTAEGTRVGMTLREARKRERGHGYTYHRFGCEVGLWRSQQRSRLVIEISRGRVIEFRLDGPYGWGC